MKIEILGSGCTKCNELYAKVKVLTAGAGDFDVVKVTDITVISSYGIMSTPAIAIDGDVKVSGRMPKDEELLELFGIKPSVLMDTTDACGSCSSAGATCGSGGSSSCACGSMPIGTKFKFFLLAIVAVSLMAVIVRSFNGTCGSGTCGFGEKIVCDTRAGEAESSQATKTADLIVYYFHGNMRCVSCNKIENFTANTLQARFTEQLKSGSIDWRVVNTDEPANAHFIQDFEITSKTVVLVSFKDGKQLEYKRLDGVWNHLDDAEVFGNYIAEGVNSMLEK